MPSNRLSKQIQFIKEVDKLKSILRRNNVIGTQQRNENDAEHSWHLGIMAMLLSEYSNRKIDLLKVIKMVLIHDMVEIDAGDTFCYDKKAYEDKLSREITAANRVFCILPEDQSNEMMSLWKEFEELESPEAIFAGCLDRLQPFIMNSSNNGQIWREENIKSKDIMERNNLLQRNTIDLWEYIKEIIDNSLEEGVLLD